MGTVISVINHKGGVGKSTSILNLAGILVDLFNTNQKARVLLVDLDPQQTANRCVSGKVNIQNNNLPEALLASPVDSAPFSTRIQPSKWERVWYIPSDLQGMMYGESQMVEVGRHMNPMKVLASQLRPIKSRFDFILLDTGQSQGTFLWNALFASDFVIIPTQTSSEEKESVKRW